MSSRSASVSQEAPGLDVAGAEEFGYVEAGNRTAAIPVFEQAAAEDVLADPLHDQSFGFRGAGQVRGFVLEGTEESVGERPGELERAAQEAMERG